MSKIKKRFHFIWWGMFDHWREKNIPHHKVHTMHLIGWGRWPSDKVHWSFRFIKVGPFELRIYKKNKGE